MTTLSPPNMQKLGVVCTGLAWDKSGQPSREMAQIPEKTMNKLAPVPDLVINTGWETGMYQGSLWSEVGANSFFNIQPMTWVRFKHSKQLKVRNTEFSQCSAAKKEENSWRMLTL